MAVRAHGRAVQVVLIKPTLKAPGYMLLKLRYDGPLSEFAFKFNLRRYTMASRLAQEGVVTCVATYTLFPQALAPQMWDEVSHAITWTLAGAYTRLLLGST